MVLAPALYGPATSRVAVPWVQLKFGIESALRIHDVNRSPQLADLTKPVSIRLLTADFVASEQACEVD